jgi:hypothetical protein
VRLRREERWVPVLAMGFAHGDRDTGLRPGQRRLTPLP